MLFIRDDILSKLLNVNTSISGIENLLVQINLRSKKWFISGFSYPDLNSIQNCLTQLSKNFDFCSFKYENFIVLGDFNAEPTTIDHILINHPRRFQHFDVSDRRIWLSVYLWKYTIPNRILKSYNTEITRTLSTNISGETFCESYLFKTFNLMNLINLNLLPQNY